MALTASAELPLYLQMSRYTKGSKAVMELRTQQYLANKADKPTDAATAEKPDAKPASDDNLTTASLGDSAETESLSFDAWLDVVNPLQHIPGVSTVYREVTGDELNPAARIVGGGLFGGPLGAGLSLLESLIEEASGLDVGGHVASWFDDDPSTANGDTRTATPSEVAPIPTSPAPALTADTTPIPTLSPEMFEALLTDKSAEHFPERARAESEQTVADPKAQEAPAAPVAPVPLSDFAAAMERGLEQYESEHVAAVPAD